jgi:hypothetical protein
MVWILVKVYSGGPLAIPIEISGTSVAIPG